LLDQRGEEPGDAPEKGLGLEGSGIGEGFLAEEEAAGVVQQRTREGKGGIRPDPVAARELHRQPALHAFALDDDGLAQKHVRERFRNQLGERVDQSLRAVAAMNDEHGPGVA